MATHIPMKNHRGISSIIGSFFFLMLMFAAFGAMIVAFQYQADLTTANMAISDMQTKKIQERFTIAPVASDGVLTFVTTKNQGSNPIEVVDLWVIDKGTPYGATRYSVNSLDSFVPAGATTNIVANQIIGGLGSGGYTIKAVTDLGSIATADIPSSTTVPDPEDLLADRLIAKPAIYAAFPNPFTQATAGKRSYFSLTVANPTNVPITIYQLAMQLVNPNNPSIIDVGDDVICDPNCDHVVLWPKAADGSINGTWTFDKEFISWKNGTTPITVAPYSAMNFTVLVHPHASIADSPINTVGTNTYTSYGQFGNTKIDTMGTENTLGGVPNIYQSSSSSGNDVKYVVLGAKTNLNKIYNFTVHNTGDKKIYKNSYLVINIPKGFGSVSEAAGSSPDLILELPITVLYDSSQQIRVKLNTDLISGEKRTFVFQTTSPIVSSTKMYLFYSYMTGIAETADAGENNKKIIGSLAESLIQVVP